MDVFKRLLLESENLIERLEEDQKTKRKWKVEFESLLDTIKEARGILWPKGEEIKKKEKPDMLSILSAARNDLDSVFFGTLMSEMSPLERDVVGIAVGNILKVEKALEAGE